MPDRRTFLKAAAASGTLLAFGTVPLRPRPAPLKILILGGTGFIGPYQVRYALDRGHTVTLFNRGRTNPGLFPEVEKLVGDRTGDLTALDGRTWDAVIDNSATDPAWVERSARLLADTVQTYLFVSTRSVYFDTSRVPMTVDAPVFTRENTPVEAGARLPYGLSKALAEREAHRYFPGRALVVRPSLIVGPGDPHREGRRDPGAGRRQRPGADHRRSRLLRVDDPAARATRDRCVQRARTQNAALIRRAAPWHQGGHHVGGHLHLGRRRFPPAA
jgi:2'-hydroxyisoflavone reductase